MSVAQRIAFYSHDTFGLGHLTRSLRIARAVKEACPAARVLVLTGSPVADSFRFPEGIEYLKLPPVRKVAKGRYVARDEKTSPRKIRKRRSKVILEAMSGFRPDLFFVDNVPLGMKGELEPTLEFLRRELPRTRIHLNLRDVLDDPETLRADWILQGTYGDIERYFDSLNVFGHPAVFDSIREYGLPGDKAGYLGYLKPSPCEYRDVPPLPPVEGDRARVLVTLGGGGDGEDIVDSVLRLQERLGQDSPYHFHVVLGPLMEPAKARGFRRRADASRHLDIRDYVPGMPLWMEGCDLVLSMGGYNTLCEVLAHAARSVVVPRTSPRTEQLIRAEALAELGRISFIRPEELSPERLDREMRRSLESDAPGRAGKPPQDGAERIAKKLRQAAESAPPASKAAAAGASGGAGVVGTGRGFFRNIFRTLGLFLLMLILALPARAGLRPESVLWEVAYGLDSNLLNASDAELIAFETEDPEAFFVVDAMEDRFLASRLEAGWLLGRPGGRKLKLRAGCETQRYLDNAIRSEDAWSLELLARMSSSTRLGLALKHSPQVYARHRRDKDALPGEPMFRAEVHRRWDLGLQWRQVLVPDWTLDTELAGSYRDYVTPFDERDRRRLTLESGLAWRARRGLRLGLQGKFRLNRSRNEPDLGKDLSYREWGLKPGLSVVAWRGLALDAACAFSWRHYLSEKDEDWNHRGRDDRFGALELRAAREFPGFAELYIEYQHAWRKAELDSGLDVDYDEEGSFSENVWTGGVIWRWEPAD